MKAVLNTIGFAALTLSLGSIASADPIAYTNAPLGNVVAQLSQKLGVQIELEGGLASQSNRRVTFDVGDTGTDPTRLETINALADAAGVTEQKGFVVSKISAAEEPAKVLIDSDGPVYFKTLTLPARQAIALVALHDGATVDIAPDVTGTVTMSAQKVDSKEAAQEIAKQTHTDWKTYYALVPAGMAQRGTVVGHSNDGEDMVELPFTAYNPPTPPAPAPTASTTPSATGAQTPAPVGTSTAPNSGVGVSPYPYGYDPYMGYPSSPYYSYGDGYGYTPYGAGPYQYQYGGYGDGGYGNRGVTITPGTGGYGPFGGYGSPVTF